MSEQGCMTCRAHLQTYACTSHVNVGSEYNFYLFLLLFICPLKSRNKGMAYTHHNDAMISAPKNVHDDVIVSSALVMVSLWCV